MARRSKFPRASQYLDRHGVRRWRYRRRGVTVQLGKEYGSDDFIRRYEAAEKGQKPIGASFTRPGSFDALIVRWYQSSGFLNLSASTKATYRNIVERWRAEHGAKQVTHLERRHILAMHAAKSSTPAAANNLVKMLRLLLDHAIDLDWRTDNPARRVKMFTTNPDGFHTWSEMDICAFYKCHQPGTTAHLAMTLMLYTGASRSDAVKLGWASIRSGRLSYRRQKTARHSEIIVDIPLHPELAAALELVPANRFTFLETSRGASRSANGLGNAMRRWCDVAGLPDCTSHGLRKAIARRLAEAGATPNMVKSVTGHKSTQNVEIYTAKADRAGLADASMRLISGVYREQKLANHPKRLAKESGKPLKNRVK